MHSGCCISLPSETFLKLGMVILKNGEWEGQKLLTPKFVSTMLTPTGIYKYGGLVVYLGKDYKQHRGPGNPKKMLW